MYVNLLNGKLIQNENGCKKVLHVVQQNWKKTPVRKDKI